MTATILPWKHLSKRPLVRRRVDPMSLDELPDNLCIVNFEDKVCVRPFVKANTMRKLVLNGPYYPNRG